MASLIVFLVPWPLSVVPAALTQGGVVQVALAWFLFVGALLLLFSHYALPWWKADPARGVLVVFFPSWVYDLSMYLMLPLNWMIHAACHLQPGTNEWDDRKGVEGTDLEALKTRLLEGQLVTAPDEALIELFDSLPRAVASDLIGRTWHGRIIPTGKSILDLAQMFLVTPLSLLGLAWGKRYVSRHVGDPLLVNWNKKFYIPLPAWGNVGMVDMVFRGKLTATMNYDHQPWKDYFAVLSEGEERVTLLGLWTSREKTGGWFLLTSDRTVPM